MSSVGAIGPDDVKFTLCSYHNCDDVLLFWRTSYKGQWDSALPACLGFRLERQRRLDDGSWDKTEIIRNRVGFDAKEMEATLQESGQNTKPSSVWPFQRYDWTDHGANHGQVVRYRVAALSLPLGGEAGTTELEGFATSDWTRPIDVSAECGRGISAYFNRGNVMSQFVARIMRQNGWKPRDIKEHVKDLEEPLRRFLSGDLRLALLDVLDEVIDDPGLELYAALYELADDELVDRLKLLRGRAHLVLANGSDKSGDGNADARKALKKAKVDVHDRLLGSKGLGHNKFAVVVRTQGEKPRKAWTGSTNWSASGLCTQLNNGITIEDRDVANAYYQQWQRLAEAGSDFPKELVAENAKSPRTFANVDVWFTRVRNRSKNNTDPGSDLQALMDLVKSAKEVILYVMFQPGPEPLQSILARGDKLYVRGVASTLASATKEQFTLSGIDTESRTYQAELVQPKGIVGDFSAWIKEVTRSQFLFPNQNPGVGHAITHAKMIVVDPFDDDCAVVTGSHNFSRAASEANDENFVVIRNNKALAEAYAVACIATYGHYRWRAYVKDMVDAGKTPWDHLSTDPDWQKSYLTPERLKHLDVWCPT